MKFKIPLEYLYSINIVIIRTVIKQNKALSLTKNSHKWSTIHGWEKKSWEKLFEPVIFFFHISHMHKICVLCGIKSLFIWNLGNVLMSVMITWRMFIWIISVPTTDILIS